MLPDAACSAAGLLPGWGPWIAGICALLGPRLFNMADLCDSPPPDYPEVNPVTLAEQGILHTWSERLSQWVWAAWVNANWSTWCECNPTTGPGPCPPVAAFGGAHTTRLNDSYKMVQRVSVPHGWTSYTRTYRLTASNAPGNIYVAMLLEDAAMAPLQYVQLNTRVSMAVGGVSTATDAPLYNSTSRANVRYASVWTLPTNTGGNVASTLYNVTATSEITFTGTCQDTVIIPPPPDPTPAPPPPDAPAPPPLPSGCSTDDLCAMLYTVLQELHRQGTLITVLQRYLLPFGINPGTVHSGLSGSGSFTISNILGVRIDITSPPPGRQLEGNPPYLWDQGWLSIMTPDGMIEERRLTRDGQVWHPRMMQEATTFGYWLHPGVSATITELWPEAY